MTPGQPLGPPLARGPDNAILWAVPPASPKPRRKGASGPSGPTIPHANRKGVRLDVYLPDDLAGQLDDRCIDLGMSRTEAVRLALTAWLEAPSDD